MKTKKRLFAVWTVCLLALACGALFACSKSDVKVTEFNVAETATAQVNSYYAVPSVTASLSDGSKLPAEATVTDSAGTAVTLTNGRFYVSDVNGYTIVYRVVLDGKTLAEKRTALTVVDESLPEIAVLLPSNKVVRTGTAYTIDESKISVDEGTALSYAVTRGETPVDFDEENKRFTVSEEGRYDITITATRDGRSSSEVYSVYGVNRGDDVFADFEYETDLAYFESRGGDYDVSISRNTDPAFVHSGTGSLKVTSTGNNYPTVLVTSDSNLNVRGGVTLSMWLYLDVPAGYEYTDQLFVNFMYGSSQWGFRPAGIDGYATNKPGEWIYFTMGLEDGYSLSTMNFYLAVQGTTVTAVSPQVSLYIDDIRIESYLDGDKTYFVTGSTFDLADMATAFCDGNGVAYPADELTVTEASGEPADVTDGVLAFPEEGNYEYRVAHPAVDEYVSIVRRDVTLADGIIEYAVTGAYDVGLFDASVAVKYAVTTGYDGSYPALQKEWNAGTDFTVAFAEDLGIDFARGAVVTFDTYLIGTNDAAGYTVALQKAGEEEQALYTHEGNVAWTKKTLSFTVPAGGSITDYALHVTMGKGWGWLLYNVKIAMDDAYAVGDGNVVVPADTETYDLSQIPVYDAQTGEETDAAVRWKVFDGAGSECALTGTTLTLTENVYTVQATVGGERHTFSLVRHTAEALDTAKTGYTYAFLGKEENAYQTALFDSTLPLAYGSSSYNNYTDIKVNNYGEKPYAMQLATMNWNPLDLTITLKSDAGIPTDVARTLAFDLYLVGTSGASTFSITAASAAGDEVFTQAYTGWTVNGTISMKIPAGVSLAGLQLHFISGSSSYFYANDFVITVQAGEAA